MEKWRQFETDLEDKPVVQIKFHKRMMRVWAANAPVVLAIYGLSWVFPAYAVQIAAFLGAYTAIISLYANWVSDFDGVSAAQSTLETLKQNQTIKKPVTVRPGLLGGERNELK